MSRTLTPAFAAPELREVLTPEGVPLRLALARPGDRIAAFLFDGLLILLACIGVWLLALSARSGRGAGWTDAIAIIATFVIANGYFIFFESRGGRTPGKRVIGTRVIDAQGGPLRTEAVFARNLTRDIEVLLPLAALMAPDALWPGAPAWGQVIACVWLLVLGALPLLNRDRLRAGDVIAGTLVVRAPRAALLDDIAAGGDALFTVVQLDHYGAYELQVLEDLLREPAPDPRAVATVAEKIRSRIKWTQPIGVKRLPDLAFLREFYAAQRSHLEKKLLFGERRADKKAARGTGGKPPPRK